MHQPSAAHLTNEVTSFHVKAVIRVLIYFDLFSYPLTREEIIRFCGTEINPSQADQSIDDLKSSGIIFQFGDLFSLRDDLFQITRRKKGNIHAEKMLPVAKKKGRLIAGFPFVRAVMASGSLSKGYMDESSDLDFFIVTEPGRLWIARTMLVLYKRFFLNNSHREFCVNYFVSFDQLTIEEKNQFTATELATVIPLYGDVFYRKLIDKNRWVFDFFPNYIERPTTFAPDKELWVKRVFEKVINFAGGTRLERWCMKVTMKRWRRLYEREYPREDFEIAFKSREYVSKNHPRHFQRQVISKLSERYAELGKKFELEL
jgi:hypothetical protein